MATKEKTKPEAEEGEETGKGGRKKLLLIALVALLALGAGAYFFLFSGSGEAAAEEPEKGSVLVLDPVAVNLAGGGYLKVGVALQLTADAAAGHGGEGPDGSMATDLIISTFSQAKPVDVANARDAFKESLQEKIIEAYTEDGHETVMGIYFTQYVTQ
jgi:flagellar protein FliL